MKTVRNGATKKDKPHNDNAATLPESALLSFGGLDVLLLLPEQWTARDKAGDAAICGHRRATKPGKTL